MLEYRYWYELRTMRQGEGAKTMQSSRPPNLVVNFTAQHLYIQGSNYLPQYLIDFCVKKQFLI